MTSFAFILGVVPLLSASGAGAEARKVMGTAVFSGMIVATCFAVVLIPVFYALVQRMASRGRPHGAAKAAAIVPAEAEH
jgi:HAE1 family hydrophobic/amphiphilic exporter-1